MLATAGLSPDGSAASTDHRGDEASDGRPATGAGGVLSSWGLGVPLVLYVLLLFVVPLVSVIRASFATSDTLAFKGISSSNYSDFVTSSFYWHVFLNTAVIAGVTVAVTALIGLPFAYALSTSTVLRRLQFFALFSPLLVNGVVRLFGIQVLFASINNALEDLHIASHGLPLLYSYYGIVIAQVSFLFPYMTMAIYASIARIDPELPAAARTLGASRQRVFRDIVVPLARPGIVAGSILTFAAAAGSYVIPQMMGGGRIVTMPILVYNSVSEIGGVPFGAAVALLLAAVVLPLLLVSSRKALDLGSGGRA